MAMGTTGRRRWNQGMATDKTDRLTVVLIAVLLAIAGLLTWVALKVSGSPAW